MSSRTDLLQRDLLEVALVETLVVRAGLEPEGVEDVRAAVLRRTARRASGVRVGWRFLSGQVPTP